MNENTLPETLVPIIAIIVIFGLPITGWIVMRVLAHRERMPMLERGMMPPPDVRGWQRMNRAGWSAGPPHGAGVPGAAPRPQPWHDDESAQDSLRRGIKTTMIGFALLIGLSFIGYHGGGGPLGFPSIEPGPWLLGGLIPTFIGFAQILVAVLSGARIGPTRPRANGMPPSSGAAGYEPPPAARPVHPFEELPPSPRPPERR